MTANQQLRYEREVRGWSQNRVAQEIGTTLNSVSMWERGLAIPSPYFREQLCRLFEKNAQELGFLEEKDQQSKEQKIEGNQLYRDNAVSCQSISKDKGTRTAALLNETVAKDHDEIEVQHTIFEMVAQNLQAYKLWQLAYIASLKEQQEQAEKLGQESLSSFEHLKELNVSAIQTWLDTLQKEKSSQEQSSFPHKQLLKRSSRFIPLMIFFLALISIIPLIAGLTRTTLSYAQPHSSVLARTSLTSVSELVSCTLKVVPPSTPTLLKNAVQLQIVANCHLSSAFLVVYWGDGQNSQIQFSKQCTISCTVTAEHSYTTIGNYASKVILAPEDLSVVAYIDVVTQTDQQVAQTMPTTPEAGPQSTGTNPSTTTTTIAVPSISATPTPNQSTSTTITQAHQAALQSQPCTLYVSVPPPVVPAGLFVHLDVETNCVQSQHNTLQINWGDGSQSTQNFPDGCVMSCVIPIDHVYVAVGHYTATFQTPANGSAASVRIEVGPSEPAPTPPPKS